MSILLLVAYLISIIGMVGIATITIIGSKEYYRRFFAISIYLTATWLLIQYLVQALHLRGAVGLALIQLASSLSMLMAISLYLFIRTYIGKSISTKKYSLIFSLAILSFIANFSGLLIKNVTGNYVGITVVSSKFYLFYIILVGIIFIASLLELFINTLKNRSKKHKSKNRLMIFGILQAVFLVVVSNIFLQSFAESQIVMPVSLLIMTIMMGLAIIKYRFFDIKFAVIRTFAYLLSLLTLSAIYYVVAYLISLFLFKENVSSSLSISPMNIALALLLAFVFQPIKHFFDRVTNKFFFKDNYNSDDFFANVNKTLGSTIDLRGMLERVSSEIAKTLKGEQAFFFINVDEEHFITAGTPGHKLLPKSDAKMFENVTETKDGVVIASMLEEENDIKRMMVSHRVELVLPLVKDKKTIGYLCLGEHLTSSYKNRDITVLNAISSGLIIAIQNALAVQEIREFNETLKQRIANATEELRASNRMLRQLDKAKDEFVGMASHQLRTPLTSVKGYISMVLEGDAGKVNSSQEQLLNEAFNSSERMVNLINDFLNVSRIQTGKFIIERNEFDLSKLVEEEISDLESSAAAHNLKFNYKKPSEFPMIIADMGKIRQVVMNFLDNAIYYSQDNALIDVDVVFENDHLSFTVKDSGIGVPINERSQLFTKFYRASNARRKRPDGTGVGLYLAKKIIDAHEGKIIFESTEGKGSTFGFSLPVK